MSTKRRLQSAEASEPTTITSARCHVFKHQLDGNVYEETRDGHKRWVARLQCRRCGTWRTDVMMPYTCDLVSRKYEHPQTYETQMSHQDAKKILFKRMMEAGVGQ